MPWITQIKIADSKTVKTDGMNQKCEREIVFDFSPGEVKADDTPVINKWLKEGGKLLKADIDECLKGMEPTPGEPEKPGPPQKATDRQITFLKDLMARKNVKVSEVLEEYEIKELKELTKEQANGAITRLKEKR